MDSTINYYRNKNDFLKQTSGLDVSRFSCINSSVKTLSSFANMRDIELPFLITGRLVTSGIYKEKNYGEVMLPARELKETIMQWKGLMIYTSHKVYEKVMRGEDVSVNEVVGRIIDVRWNPIDNGIDFDAEIYDQQIAFKMASGVIRFISVGFAREVIKMSDMLYYHAIEPKEASLVFDPRDKKAEFAPVDENNRL